MSGWLEKMFYAPNPGVALSGMSQSLRPLAGIYALVAQQRLKQGREAQSQHRCRVPVISVGNYVAGGGGKTPMVIWLAQYFLSQNISPAVLIRGYGGSGQALRVCGKLTNDERKMAGDEATLISETLGSVPVFVGKNRVVHASQAEQEASVIILDDGLQHTALYRDWDVVCFKGEKPIGNGYCLPSGPLREPLPKERPERSTWLHYALPSHEVWEVADAGVHLQIQDIENAQGEPLAKTRPLYLLCGVARPAQVKASLEVAGWTVKQFHPLGDHQSISNQLLFDALKAADDKGCALVLTAKDGARLDTTTVQMKNLHILKTALEWRNNIEKKSFCASLDRVVAPARG